jgi:hypothetical protein
MGNIVESASKTSSMPTMKNMSTPRSASIDMIRCDDARGSAAELSGNRAARAAEAFEGFADIRESWISGLRVQGKTLDFGVAKVS